MFQGSDDQLQDMYQNHQRTVKEKEHRLTECQHELERAGRDCQRMNHIKSDLLVEQGGPIPLYVSVIGDISFLNNLKSLFSGLLYLKESLKEKLYPFCL